MQAQGSRAVAHSCPRNRGAGHCAGVRTGVCEYKCCACVTPSQQKRRVCKRESQALARQSDLCAMQAQHGSPAIEPSCVCVCARVCLCVRVRVCVCPTRHQVRVRWRVRAWSKGCARMQACGSPAMCRACISEGVRTPFPTLHPPCVRLTHFLDHAPRMRKPALLLTPLPLSLRL